MTDPGGPGEFASKQCTEWHLGRPERPDPHTEIEAWKKET